MSILFARFAATPIGAGLVSRDGGLTVTTNANSLDAARVARSDVGHSVGLRGAEFAFWGEGDMDAGVGVVLSVADLNAAIWNVGIAWVLHNGTIVIGGVEVATGLPVIAKGEVVGVKVALNGGSPTIAFYRGSSLVHARALPGGGLWHFGVSIGAAAAGGLICAVNAGQWQAAGPAAEVGWPAIASSQASTRLADYDYLSAGSDSPAHARFEGVIMDGIMTAAELGFWPWGGEMPSNSASASCRVLDADGALDSFAGEDLRGVPVRVRLGDEAGTVAAASDVARFVLDRVEVEGEAGKTLILRDAHDDLDQPLSRGVFLPNIPGLAWKPLPVVIGAVASVPGLSTNTDGTAIYLSGRPLASVDVVMDRGDIMEGGTFAVSPNGQQLEMNSPPVGPVVADVSSIAAGPTPATLVQALTAIFAAIGKGSWSSADAAAIDAATGYAGVGYYDPEGRTVREALAAILPSYGAWWWQDSDGVLRFSRVIAPESYVGLPAFELTRADAVDDVVSVPDTAPNLTRRMAYRLNAQALGASDLVTDMVDLPQARRDELTGFWRGQVYGAGALAARYQHADSADPFLSCFWRAQDAQAELDRVLAIYAVPRALYHWRVIDPELAPKPGQVGLITHPRFGLAGGKRVLVRGVVRNPVTGDTTLTLWG